MTPQPPVAMTIAGSDSGGGAGLQADLATFAALGVFGTCAVTAVTAQSTRGVDAVHPVPADVMVQQVRTVLADLPVAAVKTGMLGTADVVTAVADLAARGSLRHLVVDPVMVATSGARLVSRDGVVAYRELLLPHASVLTPNVPEAEVLLGQAVAGLSDRHVAARQLGALGPRVVVLKGGHAIEDAWVVDVVWDGVTTYELRAAVVASRNVHGTGCTFAAAVTAGLAHGLPVREALSAAKTFVHQAIVGAQTWRLGAGSGPLAHHHARAATTPRRGGGGQGASGR